MSSQKEYAIITIESDENFSLEELCEVCHQRPDFIYELIEFGAIEPEGYSVETWRFNSNQLQRIQRILRLQQDLEVNLAGAALAIDLMEKIKELQSEVDILQKHLTKF